MLLETQMHQVSLKAPQFTEISIAGWFTIKEVQFHLKKVTAEDTKFYTIISAVPPDVVMNFSASILQSKDYEQLKQSANERTKLEFLD